VASEIQRATRKEDEQAINDDSDVFGDDRKAEFDETPYADPQKNNKGGLFYKCYVGIYVVGAHVFSVHPTRVP